MYSGPPYLSDHLASEDDEAPPPPGRQGGVELQKTYNDTTDKLRYVWHLVASQKCGDFMFYIFRTTPNSTSLPYKIATADTLDGRQVFGGAAAVAVDDVIQWREDLIHPLTNGGGGDQPSADPIEKCPLSLSWGTFVTIRGGGGG